MDEEDEIVLAQNPGVTPDPALQEIAPPSPVPELGTESSPVNTLIKPDEIDSSDGINTETEATVAITGDLVVDSLVIDPEPEASIFSLQNKSGLYGQGERSQTPKDSQPTQSGQTPVDKDKGTHPATPEKVTTTSEPGIPQRTETQTDEILPSAWQVQENNEELEASQNPNDVSTAEQMPEKKNRLVAVVDRLGTIVGKAPDILIEEGQIPQSSDAVKIVQSDQDESIRSMKATLVQRIRNLPSDQLSQEHSADLIAEDLSPNPWRAIIDAQLIDLAKAKQHGDSEIVSAIVKEMIITIDLANSDGRVVPVKEVVLELVRVGAAKEVLDTSREMRNIVVLEPPEPEGYDSEWGDIPEESPRMGQICSITAPLKSIIPVIEYATKNLVDSTIELIDTERSLDSFNITESMIALEAASSSEVNPKEKDHKIDAITHHMMCIILNPYQGPEESGGGINYYETLVKIAEINPRLLGEQFEEDFTAIRDLRRIGSMNRNDHSFQAYGGDELLATSIALGRNDIAEKLLTAHPDEIVDGQNTVREVIDATKKYGGDPSEALTVLQQIVRGKQEKVSEQFQSVIQTVDLSSDQISHLERIVNYSGDPEVMVSTIAKSASLITSTEKIDPHLSARIQTLLYGYYESGQREQGLLFSNEVGESAVSAASLVSLLSSERLQRHLGSINLQDLTTGYDVRNANAYLSILDSPLFESMDTSRILEIIPQEGREQFAKSLSSLNVTPELLGIFEDDGLDPSVKNRLIYQLCSADDPIAQVEALTSVATSTNLLKMMNKDQPLFKTAEYVTKYLLSSPDAKELAAQIESIVAETELFPMIESDLFINNVMGIVFRKVMQSENPFEKAREIEAALSESGLISSFEHDGLARTYVESLAILVTNSENPSETALRIVSLNKELDATLTIPKDRITDITGYIAKRIFDRRGRSKDPDILQRTRSIIDIANNTDLFSLFKQGNSHSVIFGEAIFNSLYESAPEEALAKAIQITDAFTQLDSLLEATPQYKTSAQKLITSLKGDLPENINTVASIAQETNLLDIFLPESGLSSLSDTIINNLRNSNEPLQLAKQISDQLTSDSGLWFSLYQVSKIASGEVSTVGYQEGLSVRRIPRALPLPNFSDEQNKEVLRKMPVTNVADMTIEEKRQVANLSNMTDEEVAALTTLPFDSLTEGYQDTVLAFRIFEAVTLSRSIESKESATSRNAELVRSQHPVLSPGDLVHSTRSTQTLREILTDGALCGEAIGPEGEADTYPFNLDAVAVGAEVSGITHTEALESLDATSYGNIGIVFRRGQGSLNEGEEFSASGGIKNHTLVLGGLPATEIKAIVIRTPSVSGVVATDLEQIRSAVIDSDIYIPVIGYDGTIELTFEQWEAEREDRNFAVAQPVIVDSATRIPDTQKGSNDGALFLMPQDGIRGRGADGSRKKPIRNYVKFGETKPEHIASELLADSLYRAVHPELVPKTFPAIIEGRFARVAEWREAEGEVTQQAKNEGFVMDCLLGNWDAPFNTANILMSNGHGLRIDTGGALEFRAQGEKKGEAGVPEFGEVVTEIEVGNDRSKLGNGMRQEYPGLSDEEIKEQVNEMHEKLTDDIIEHLVDGQRLPSADRDRLKQVLKARRDYIIKRFSPELISSNATESVPENLPIAA